VVSHLASLPANQLVAGGKKSDISSDAVWRKRGHSDRTALVAARMAAWKSGSKGRHSGGPAREGMAVEAQHHPALCVKGEFHFFEVARRGGHAVPCGFFCGTGLSNGDLLGLRRGMPVPCSRAGGVGQPHSSRDRAIGAVVAAFQRARQELAGLVEEVRARSERAGSASH